MFVSFNCEREAGLNLMSLDNILLSVNFSLDHTIFSICLNVDSVQSPSSVHWTFFQTKKMGKIGNWQIATDTHINCDDQGSEPDFVMGGEISFNFVQTQNKSTNKQLKMNKCSIIF